MRQYKKNLFQGTPRGTQSKVPPNQEIFRIPTFVLFLVTQVLVLF